jgi:hypothetical protein
MGLAMIASVFAEVVRKSRTSPPMAGNDLGASIIGAQSSGIRASCATTGNIISGQLLPRYPPEESVSAADSDDAYQAKVGNRAWISLPGSHPQTA